MQDRLIASAVDFVNYSATAGGTRVIASNIGIAVEIPTCIANQRGKRIGSVGTSLEGIQHRYRAALGQFEDCPASRTTTSSSPAGKSSSVQVASVIRNERGLRIRAVAVHASEVVEHGLLARRSELFTIMSR